MTDPAKKSPSELVKTFQVLDNVAKVLSMVLDGTEASTVSSTVAKIHSRFQECETLLENLPGGSMSKVEQNRKIEELTSSINKRKSLVSKYGNLDLLRQIAMGTQNATEPVSQNSTLPAPPTFKNRATQPMDFSTHLNHRQSANIQSSLMDTNVDHLFFGAPHVSQAGLMPTSGSLNVSSRNLGDKGLDPMEM